MEPREEYYKLLNSEGISDTLNQVSLSYSAKKKIIENLLKRYPKEYINRALNIYQTDFISIGNYNLSFLEQTLRGIISRRVFLK